jgi:hypothetical protein
MLALFRMDNANATPAQQRHRRVNPNHVKRYTASNSISLIAHRVSLDSFGLEGENGG